MAVMSPLEMRRLQELMKRNPTALARLAGLEQGGGTLGEVAGMAPPPRTVSPGQPAQMQQGQEIIAPPLQAPQQQLNVAPVGPGTQRQAAVPTTGAAVQGDAAMRAAAMMDRARAAQTPEEISAILSSRKARYDEQLGEVEADRKKAGWEALATAGFKMAQSQSPYFMSALASGMEAGLNGYSAKKAAAAERKARIQDKQEENILTGFKAKREEEDRVRAQQVQENILTGQIMAQGETADKIALANQVRPSVVENAQLLPDVTRAGILRDVAAASLANRTDPNLPKTGGGEMTPDKVMDLRDSLVAQLTTAQKIAADRFADPAMRKKAQGDVAVISANLQAIDAQLGLGGAPTAGVQAEFVYDPKTGRLIRKPR